MTINDEKINKAEFIKTDLGIKYLEEVEKLKQMQKVLIKSAEEFFGISLKELNEGNIFECMLEKAASLIRSAHEQGIEPASEPKAKPAAIQKCLQEILESAKPNNKSKIKNAKE